MKKIVILVSGGGSNMDAIVRAARRESWGALVQFTGVIADRPQARALTLASELRVPSACVHYKDFSSREAFEAALTEQIERFGADLVVLAGFLRVLTAGFVDRYHGRLMNIHPSLLPSFAGLHTHEQALRLGVKVHGATVHWVSAQLDHGPIIAQAAVAVLPNDTPELLAARVLEKEHRLYPQVIQWWAEERLQLLPPQAPDAMEQVRVLPPGLASHGHTGNPGTPAPAQLLWNAP